MTDSNRDSLRMNLQALLGCQWGHLFVLDDDEFEAPPVTPCTERAVQRTVLHFGEGEVMVQVCQLHSDWITIVTSPHADADG